MEVIVSKYDTVKNIYYTVFEGSVINYDLDLQKNEMILHCNNITNLLNVKAPSLSYNPSCPFKLYGKKCGVNKTSYKNTFGWNRGTWEISENNTKIYSPNNFLSHDMTKYKNGYIVIRDNGNSSQEIPIVDTTDDSIILLYPISFDFEDISDFDVFYGCNKNINDCENKFNNLLNFGGFRFVPSQNYTNGI